MCDAHSDAVVAAYQQHRASITDALPQRFQEFESSHSIHDAQVRRLRLDHGQRTLGMELIAGDNDRGYSDLHLTYLGVDRLPSVAPVLARIAGNSEAEALYAEIDVGADGTFLHRWLWWPYEELDICFTAFDFAVTPRTRRSFRRPSVQFVQVAGAVV